MIVARVDLRIVAEKREQLIKELNLIQERDRTHIDGWIEDHYNDGRKPRSKKAQNAIEVVTAKLEG